jgi:hypothetical protein
MWPMRKGGLNFIFDFIVSIDLFSYRDKGILLFAFPLRKMKYGVYF